MAIIVLIVFFLLFHILDPIANSTTVEKLTLGSIFSNSDTLQSSNGVFQLGLVSIGGALYLGISYSKPLTNVWVANRNNPIKGAFASFGLDARDLALTLKNDAGQVVWSAGRNASVAVLLDTGNLVLQSPNQSHVWESFDYPGNTWLPYMKMGIRTNLTSWVAPDNPSDGPFSMIMLHTTAYVLLWRNNMKLNYSTSGAWVDGKGYPNIPQMHQTVSYNYSFTGDGFSWNPYDGYATFLSRIILDDDGIIKHQKWDNADFGWSILWGTPKQCQVYSFCGAFGICQANSSTPCSCPPGFSPTNSHHWTSQVWYEGCKPNVTLNCDRDREFTRLDQISFDMLNLTTQYSTLDYSRCMDACKKNCDCTGFYFDARAKNCSLFSGELLNGKVSSATYDTGVFYLRVPAGTIINTDSRKSEKRHYYYYYYIMGLIIGIIFCLLLVMAGVMMVLRQRRTRVRKGLAKSSFDPVLGGLLTVFRYKEIQAATNNFSEILGSGGFGSVFKGTLPNASIIAVKKLNWLRQGEKQFRNEVSTIGTIQHVNLIRLLGFTCEGQHRLLAYEYMSNGSLDAWLFGKRTSIDWASRYRIALGTARGIAYLHEDCLHRIIHCDIKPENILLDHQFNAKVSDFGLAKILGKEFSRVMTTFRGTRGYLAPEWIAGMPLTTKVDMYSYGMTLLEIISGRRNMVQKDSQVSGEDCKNLEVVFFPIWAAKQMSKGNLLSLVDKRILENVNEEELRKLAYVAGWCIQDEEDLRPTMKNVLAILEGTIDVDGPPPIPESLQLLTLNDDEDV